MPTFRLTVTQVRRIERAIEVEVDADTLEAAIELQAESDAPRDGWRTIADTLEDEGVRAA